METLKTFEDLKCWQACRDLQAFVRIEVVPNLPDEERFRLIDQITRAARSTTANLAEGYGRFHDLDNARFCSNSRASCREVLDHLITANEEGYISDLVLASGRDAVNTAVKPLNGHITYLQKSAGNPGSSDLPSSDNG